VQIDRKLAELIHVPLQQSPLFDQVGPLRVVDILPAEEIGRSLSERYDASILGEA
jgi:hypothetical protein